MKLPDFSMLDAVLTPAFVLTQDPDGRIVYAFMNEAGCRDTALSQTQVVGKTAAELFAGRAGKHGYQRHKTIWDAGVEATYQTLVSLSYGTAWIETRICPRFDDSGAMTHMVGVCRDITRERALEHMQPNHETVVNELRDYVAMTAHDLRSPMANVRMLADALRDGFVDMGDGKLEMIEMIEQVSDKVLGQISQILSKTLDPSLEQAAEPFDFAVLCDDILITLDPSQRHSVRIVPAMVEADLRLFHLSLRNLLDNAIKHGGRAALSMDLSVVPAADGRIQLTVADNGCGFADPSLSFLDEVRDVTQNGLGLAAVRKMLRERGGALFVTSPAGGPGASVTVDLPGRLVSAATVTEVA
ncbi:MAG: PAS domain-containing sensor histidine kinase [Pseudomonadota bacterium]